MPAENTPAPREILVHLNVEVPADDPRSADVIAEAVMAALEVGLEGAAEVGFGVGLVVMTLAEDA